MLRPLRLLLVNPNTSAETTAAMVAIAAEAAPAGVRIEGATARFGAPLITDEASLSLATEAVAALVGTEATEGFDGVIVAAFGDPGLAALRASLRVSVTGIAEAGMAEAAAIGPFAVVTTTPALSAAIARAASMYGHGEQFRGVCLTEGDPHAVMADPARLVAALAASCVEAIRENGAAAIVIGGGPLAVAARALRHAVPAAIVEPVPAAVRLAVERAAAYRRPLVR